MHHEKQIEGATIRRKKPPISPVVLGFNYQTGTRKNNAPNYQISA